MPSNTDLNKQPNLLTGVVLILIGSMLLSSKGIFTKFLYQYGLSYLELAMLRAVISLPLFWLWAIYQNGISTLLSIDRIVLLVAMAAGFIAYYIAALLDLYALTLIDASLERILLYTYPALIVIIASVRDRKLPEPRVFLAVLLTYSGVMFAIGGFDPYLWQQNSVGSVLVLICALMYAGYFFANEFAGKRISSSTFIVYAMTTASIALCLHYFFTGASNNLDMQINSWLILVSMVFFSMVIPIFMLAEGVKQIGAQRAGLISTVGPPSTIILAAMFLNEKMLFIQFGGVLTILLGIYVLERKPKQMNSAGADTSE